MTFDEFKIWTKGWRRKDFLNYLEYVDMWERET
jgi:hypothetical protein